MDQEAATLVRKIGHQTVEVVDAELSRRVTAEAAAQGLTVPRPPVISFQVLFGPLEVESRYLWRHGRSAPLVKEPCGITPGGRTPAVFALAHRLRQRRMIGASRHMLCRTCWMGTKVIAVADGGQGLRAAMATQSPQLPFILDQPHLVSHFSHLYEVAEAAGHRGAAREQWVSAKLSLLSAGRGSEVMEE